MNISREGRFKNSDITTGDTLSVQLFRFDIEQLVAHRFTGNRFQEFKHKELGWDSDDKAHLILSRTEVHPDDDDKLVTLKLDPGGDLTFTIWETDRLKNATGSEVFKCDNILEDDPGGKIVRLGIVAVRFYGLSGLAYELYAPKYELHDD